MSKLNLGALVAAIGLSVGFSASAQNISSDDYKQKGKTIEAQFKSDKEACQSLAGNAKDICVEKAKARKEVGEAELEQAYKPSAKNQLKVEEAKAEHNYQIAVEVCDDKAGNAKDVCIKDAKAAKTRALSDAKVRLEDAKANKTAHDKSTEVHRDAAEEKTDADFAAAKERCDAFSGDAKDKCISQAKARFGKK